MRGQLNRGLGEDRGLEGDRRWGCFKILGGHTSLGWGKYLEGDISMGEGAWEVIGACEET